MSEFNPEFMGDDLHDLILAIEDAIGSRHAGMTPLGHKIITLCEEAWFADREKRRVLK